MKELFYRDMNAYTKTVHQKMNKNSQPIKIDVTINIDFIHK